MKRILALFLLSFGVLAHQYDQNQCEAIVDQWMKTLKISPNIETLKYLKEQVQQDLGGYEELSSVFKQISYLTEKAKTSELSSTEIAELQILRLEIDLVVLEHFTTFKKEWLWALHTLKSEDFGALQTWYELNKNPQTSEQIIAYRSDTLNKSYMSYVLEYRYRLSAQQIRDLPIKSEYLELIEKNYLEVQIGQSLNPLVSKKLWVNITLPSDRPGYRSIKHLSSLFNQDISLACAIQFEQLPPMNF